MNADKLLVSCPSKFLNSWAKVCLPVGWKKNAYSPESVLLREGQGGSAYKISYRLVALFKGKG